MDREINFSLKKKVYAWWPRLIIQPQKPPWLKIDFDKWISGDTGNTEIQRNVIQDYPNMYNQLHKEEFGYTKG